MSYMENMKSKTSLNISIISLALAYILKDTYLCMDFGERNLVPTNPLLLDI